MTVYSASEAIWPALERTYSYLFRAFKWETFLKLATVATISEGFIVSFRYSVPNAFPLDIDTAALKAFLLAPAFLPVTILGAIAIFLFGVYCVYLVTRVRFGLVHCLIHQTRELRTASKLYSDEAERFFTASTLIWLAFLVLAVLVFVAFVIAGYVVIASPTPEGKLDPGNFLILFFPCIAIVFAFTLAVCAALAETPRAGAPAGALPGAWYRAEAESGLSPRAWRAGPRGCDALAARAASILHECAGRAR